MAKIPEFETEKERALRNKIIEIAARNGAGNLRIIKSSAGDAIEFLMDFTPGSSLLDLIRAQNEIQELLGGRPVKIYTKMSIAPFDFETEPL